MGVIDCGLSGTVAKTDVGNAVANANAATITNRIFFILINIVSHGPWKHFTDNKESGAKTLPYHLSRAWTPRIVDKENSAPFCIAIREPPYAERHVRWCERSENESRKKTTSFSSYSMLAPHEQKDSKASSVMTIDFICSIFLQLNNYDTKSRVLMLPHNTLIKENVTRIAERRFGQVFFVITDKSSGTAFY